MATLGPSRHFGFGRERHTNFKNALVRRQIKFSKGHFIIMFFDMKKHSEGGGGGCHVVTSFFSRNFALCKKKMLLGTNLKSIP